MTLKERINEDMKAAMRAGEKEKRDAIRLLRRSNRRKSMTVSSSEIRQSSP